jgi:hypothetical protein
MGLGMKCISENRYKYREMVLYVGNTAFTFPSVGKSSYYFRQSEGNSDRVCNRQIHIN